MLSVLASGKLFAQIDQQTSTIYSSAGVSITSQLEDCHDTKNGTHKQYVLLSISNEKNTAIKISWKRELWHDGKCTTCMADSDEYHTSVEIPANTTLSGECTENNGLRIFVKMLDLKDVRQLTHYELKEITVTDVE